MGVSTTSPGNSAPHASRVNGTSRQSGAPAAMALYRGRLIVSMRVSLASRPRTENRRPQGGNRRSSSRWSGRRESNPRQPAWEAGALPTELHPQSGARGNSEIPNIPPVTRKWWCGQDLNLRAFQIGFTVRRLQPLGHHTRSRDLTGSSPSLSTGLGRRVAVASRRGLRASRCLHPVWPGYQDSPRTLRYQGEIAGRHRRDAGNASGNEPSSIRLAFRYAPARAIGFAA